MLKTHEETAFRAEIQRVRARPSNYAQTPRELCLQGQTVPSEDAVVCL